MFRAFLVTFITFAYVLLFGPPVLIYGLLSGNTDPLYRTGMLGARVALWLAGVQLEVRGRERIPLGRPVVFMANHQSNCDLPPCYRCYRRCWCW